MSYIRECLWGKNEEEKANYFYYLDFALRQLSRFDCVLFEQVR